VGGVQCQPKPHGGGYPMVVEGQRGSGGVGATESAMAGSRWLCSRAKGMKWAVGVVGGCGTELRAHGVWRRCSQEQLDGSQMGVSMVGSAIRMGQCVVGQNSGLGWRAGTGGSCALVDSMRAAARGELMARGQQGALIQVLQPQARREGC